MSVHQDLWRREDDKLAKKFTLRERIGLVGKPQVPAGETGVRKQLAQVRLEPWLARQQNLDGMRASTFWPWGGVRGSVNSMTLKRGARELYGHSTLIGVVNSLFV